jgi:hypothetical protein
VGGRRWEYQAFGKQTVMWPTFGIRECQALAEPIP